jgi:hypothetical protein
MPPYCSDTTPRSVAQQIKEESRRHLLMDEQHRDPCHMGGGGGAAPDSAIKGATMNGGNLFM